MMPRGSRGCGEHGLRRASSSASFRGCVTRRTTRSTTFRAFPPTMSATRSTTASTEKDHAKLRDMIIAYVERHGNKVMACAEMTYQVELAKEVLVDPLPDDMKKNVVWRDTFWLPDEAASIYSKAQAVVSVECHSPLIALHNGTPAFYVRQPTDTCKGQMYRDFGSGDWFFEIDETSGEQLWSRLTAIHRDPAKAKRRSVPSCERSINGRRTWWTPSGRPAAPECLCLLKREDARPRQKVAIRDIAKYGSRSAPVLISDAGDSDRYRSRRELLCRIQRAHRREFAVRGGSSGSARMPIALTIKRCSALWNRVTSPSLLTASSSPIRSR